jgi:cytochrome c peroxidase
VRPLRRNRSTDQRTKIEVLAVVLDILAAPQRLHDIDCFFRLRPAPANPPLGLPAVLIPAGSPLTAERIALGRKLYFDRQLLHNRTMSCAMCHIPEQGFTNNEVAVPVGAKGRSLKRIAPTTFNVAYQQRMFHDARDSSLENQVFGPLLAADEMANPSVGFLLETIGEAEDYAGRFEQAFGEPVTLVNLGQALASYQRTVISANSPFDRWRYGGDENAVDDEVKAGFPRFTGVVVPLRFKAGAPSAPSPKKDRGRMGITDNPLELYAFKTPSLRYVAVTAPYMHDGSLSTPDDVVRFYRDGGVPNRALDPLIRPLQLDDEDIAALVAFLKSLTGENVDELVKDARAVAIGK